jgi:MFS superfamily sulfate permease-like transporter
MSQSPDPSPSSSPAARRWGPAQPDLLASLVVFLVALPLCLGIALASGAPLVAGVVSGVIGGVVVGLLSPSHVQVSGPAAGLTAVMLAAVATQGSFEAVLPAVIIAGALQLILGALRTGFLVRFVPSNVITGMLAAIGVILVLKQLPHLIGWDADAMGDESFLQADRENTFSELIVAVGHLHPGAALVGLSALALLFAWPKLPWPALRRVPGPLAAVLWGTLLSALFGLVGGPLAIEASHNVALPEGGALLAQLPRPDWSAFGRPSTWSVGLTIGVVASLETLLSLEASVKLDRQHRLVSADRELLAQGAGNLLSGLLGGLPLTGVIVRTTANVEAGGETRWAAVLHGLLLLGAALALGGLLNQIPLAALAAVLLQVGLKLCAPRVFRSIWARGRSQTVPFVVTLVAIVFTDLLTGVLVGLAAGVGTILRDQLRVVALRPMGPPSPVIKRFALAEHVTFLHKGGIFAALEELGAEVRVEIDASDCKRLDPDVLDSLHEFAENKPQVRLVGFPARPGAAAH